MLLSIIDPKNRLLRWLLGVAAIPIFFLKFFFGTLIGILFLSYGLYAALPHITGIEPWGIENLLLWFDELGTDAKVGLASSVVTVLGFFMALHSTMHSWRRQTTATMRMTAADSIDKAISEISQILLQIRLFADAAAKEVSRVREENLPLNSAPMLSVLSEDVLVFRANRQRLLHLQQEIIALPARYSVLLLPLPGVLAGMDKIEELVGSVTKKIWVSAPAGGTDHSDHRRHMLEQVEPQMYRELSEACESAYDKISSVQGGVRGALMSPVLEFNTIAVFQFMKKMFMRGDE